MVVVLVRQDEGAVVPARVLKLALIDADLGAARLRVKAEHDRGRERPGLRGMVRDVIDEDAGLLIDLACHRFLQALARLDKAGQGRVHSRRPDALAPQEAAITVMDQHDHRRVGARKILRLAGGVGAAAYMPALLADAGGAAHRAEALSHVPKGEASRIGGGRALMPRPERPHAAAVREFGPARPGPGLPRR